MRRSPVLDGVVALVEQSLLRQMPGSDDEPRYQMLETVREFGLERLGAAGEEDEARERHARHFLTLAERRVHGIQLFMDLESLTRVAPEQDNVRLALTWFDDHGEIDALLELSSLLYGLWLAHGLYREGLQLARTGAGAIESDRIRSSRAGARGGGDAGDLPGRLCPRRDLQSRGCGARTGVR